MADRVASPARRKPPMSNPKSRRAPGGATWDCRRRVAKKLTNEFPAARIARRNPPGRCVRQIVVEMLQSREFGSSEPFCADANPAPSEAPTPCVVAPFRHAQIPANSSLDETEGKFSSMQSIEKSQNVEIISQSGGIHIVRERRPKTSTLAAPSEAQRRASLRRSLVRSGQRIRRSTKPRGTFPPCKALKSHKTRKSASSRAGFVSPRISFAINVRRASGPGRSNGSARARAARSGSSRNARARRECPK
jgi:hypothetical protein